jgi:hypothetical protein
MVVNETEISDKVAAARFRRALNRLSEEDREATEATLFRVFATIERRGDDRVRTCKKFCSE